jgi:hypothetical protein
MLDFELLHASALIAGLRILGVEEGLPRFLTLSSRSTRRRGPTRPPRHLAAVLPTLAQGPSRPAI